MGAPPATIDAYLAGLSSDKRAALERVRSAIRSAAPDAEEAISYGLPTFRLYGKSLLWFGAAANHCAIYGALTAGFTDDLRGFDTSGKGTIRFQPDRPLPADLIGRLVEARIARNAAGGPPPADAGPPPSEP